MATKKKTLQKISIKTFVPAFLKIIINPKWNGNDRLAWKDKIVYWTKLVWNYCNSKMLILCKANVLKKGTVVIVCLICTKCVCMTELFFLKSSFIVRFCHIYLIWDLCGLLLILWILLIL